MGTYLRWRAATAAIIGMAAIGGCAAQASLSGEPIRLTILHIDGGAELDPAVVWFADAVEDQGNGEISVEIVRGCCDDTVDIEEELVDQVAAGEADLGWVGTRVFEAYGVSDLLPLTAPFLVDDYAVQQQALESDAAQAALTSVEAAGVTGIALVPGQLRRPLSVEAPILGPADWAGIPVASFHSSQNARAFEALGADPLEVTFEARDVGIAERTILALENSLTMQDLDREQTLPYAAANVGLWPRVSAIIGSRESTALANPEVRETLRAAAASVVARTGEFATIDDAAIASACSSGARFAEASASQLDALRDAVSGIWEELAANEASSELFHAIEEARRDASPAAPRIPVECTGLPGATPSPSASVAAGDPSVVNGRWATPEYTVDELLDAGFSETDAANAAVQFVLGFKDGAFEMRTGGSDDLFLCDGDYTIAGDRIDVDYNPGGHCGPGGDFFEAQFAAGSGELVLFDMRAAFESDVFLFSSTPLVLVD